ncbi:phosphoribosylformylglycinamidine synthase [Corynebacterium pyruviciproducens ATCC BAA-1742]|uniref:Phosphoribosylformylglycinamidine synthase n=1 Tax=Corynebacterium pyruviciproducens ATCC BAA-1742 TaxID=1125779 RepID=S3A3A5_9CORY|nr:phosphoribosylformylglycinamidine synthase [Corynebacterium pyruviciproducens]EPD70679.1 phosphoribosylformylglycinamidine synthase [Corynebacterium pyruviciproducens ATCC BAA-1742]
MDARFAVRRKPQFRDEERALLSTLNNLARVHLDSVQIINVYDVFGATDADLEALSSSVVSDDRVDDELTEQQLTELLNEAPSFLAVEPLPGQYDQRADAANQALRLVQPETDATIYSAVLYVFAPAPSDEARAAIRSFLINPVESGEKNMQVLQAPATGAVEPLRQYPGFNELEEDGLEALIKERGMAMSLADLETIQAYFREEGRTPTDVELSVLDTYWSDHCRHTTFNTQLTNIANEGGRFSEQLDRALRRYEELREANGRTAKPRTLMDLGTIMGRELRRTGVMDDQEVSEEINACSVYVNARKPVDSRASEVVVGERASERSEEAPWLLMFKNETHNHPTEIEPFGGASTCLGGAIRDPLSGRSWVYQALRLSGAGDINTPRENTLEGKLPQADISARATAGYSSYGNQIGLATTNVREFVHPGYVAKRMELGAVVAAAPVENVKRLDPQAGDVVIILGGRTGRDGIGGATGSSKAHDDHSLRTSGAEVQKGNPVNERKIQRLFRNPEVAQMIVRCNDFGAGGVAVAVGELADSLDIHLERVPLKYAGLNAREIAISESQERMAVVVRPDDASRFVELAQIENLEATQLAEVTDTGRLRMFLGDEKVLDLSRSFIDTNGADREQDVAMVDVPMETASPRPASVAEALATPAGASQEGMVEQFDSTVGRSTVLMPFGGATQKTFEMASIQALPVPGGTSTSSVMTYGFSPQLASDSPFLMGAYSVVEALARLTAAGADPTTAWLTVQEYFERLDQVPERWGQVTQALLGLLEAQDAFQVAAIGGKDSMSGTYGEDLHVPPTLVTFAVATMDDCDAISAAIPAPGMDVYLIAHTPLASGEPDYDTLRDNFAAFTEFARSGAVQAASAVTQAGLGATIVNMAAGNGVGFESAPDADVDWAQGALGGIVFAVEQGASVPRNVQLLGHTTEDGKLIFGAETITLDKAAEVSEARYRTVYPLNTARGDVLPEFATVLPEPSSTHETAAEEGAAASSVSAHGTVSGPAPHVLLPVFPGTNSEYDMAEAFRAAGATTEFLVIRNLTPAMLEEDTRAFVEKLSGAQILAFSGGFSLGDEPDGSAKFMAAFLRTPEVARAVANFVAGDGLVLGICNGFQALVKSGFLPYGDPAKLTETSPTLAHNLQLRHVSRIATTRVASVDSPWLSSFVPGQTHLIPVSHGEGRFVVSEEEARALFASHQVAFQYVDENGTPTMDAPANPNGSSYAIEGIVSPDGRILGKMGHPERFREGLMKNIPGIYSQDIFLNAVNYCKAQSR